MKKLLIVGLTSVLLFGLSGTASWYFQHQKQLEQQQAEHHEAAPHKAASTPPKPNHPPSDEGHPVGESSRVAARPVYTAKTDEFEKLNSEMRTRMTEVRETERQLASRKQQLDLIQHDIRGERTAIDELRTQVKKELEAVQAALADLDRRKAAMKADQGKLSKASQDLKGQETKIEKDDLDNLKKMAPIYNSMSPENVAKILKQYSDTGKIDIAAKVLLMMQGKQGSKVLDELKDPVLAAQLLEKVKGLRSPATPEPR
jgi:flagellar motility protein MotE (MotC chaperone)